MLPGAHQPIRGQDDIPAGLLPKASAFSGNPYVLNVAYTLYSVDDSVYIALIHRTAESPARASIGIVKGLKQPGLTHGEWSSSPP